MTKFPLPDPSNDDERRVVRDVVESGCHVVGVLGEGDLPPFAYSIGFWYNYQHPEILIEGLEHTLMQRVINVIREEIEQGAAFREGSVSKEILRDFPCEFRSVNRACYRDLFGYARWFYSGDDFEVLQCVWPDRSGLFPWDKAFEKRLAGRQPTCERAMHSPAEDEGSSTVG